MINTTSASLKAIFTILVFMSSSNNNFVPGSPTKKNKYLKWNLKKFCWVIQPLCTNFQGLFKKTIYMLFTDFVNYNKEPVLEKELEVLSGDSTSVYQFSRILKY